MADRVDVSHPQVCPGNDGGPHERSEHFADYWEHGPLPGVDRELRYFGQYGFCRHCSALVCFRLEIEPAGTE